VVLRALAWLSGRLGTCLGLDALGCLGACLSGESRPVPTWVSKLDLHIWGIGCLTWAGLGNGLVTKERSCVAYVAYEPRS
jgi:hypothetical protein